MKIGTTNKIQDLAPTFVEDFTDYELSESVSDTYRGKIEDYKRRIEKAAKYFFYHSHDSDILEIKKVNHKDLLMRLNDFSTLEFACALIDKKGLNINKESLIFPLEFISSGTTHLSLNIVEANGEIHPCRFRQMSEYLYEEILFWENGHIEIAFNLWKRKAKNNIYRYLLLLSCTHLKVKEYQSKAWKKYFGDRFDFYYDYFETERNAGRWLSDYSLCEKLIDEIEKLNA